MLSSNRNPGEIRWRAYAIRDAAPLPYILETEADGSGNRDKSEVHVSIAGCIDGHRDQIRPACISSRTRGARRFIRPIYVVRGTAFERAVLESHRTTLGRSSGAVGYVRPEDQFLKYVKLETGTRPLVKNDNWNEPEAAPLARAPISGEGRGLALGETGDWSEHATNAAAPTMTTRRRARLRLAMGPSCQERFQKHPE